jgi:hypothetical protein
MQVRQIFDRVCLQRVHFSFLRTLTCLKVQLLYIMVKFWVIVYLLQYEISMITISETMKTMQHHRLFDIGHHFESCTLATTTWLTVMEYLCHKWPRIYLHLKGQTQILSQNWNWFIIYSHNFIPNELWHANDCLIFHIY